MGIADGKRVLRAYPGELSGGMLQRVMIAGALAGEPELLIADEPTTALDVTIQAEIVAIFDGLRRERELAMLFITHDLELASAICDRDRRDVRGPHHGGAADGERSSPRRPTRTRSACSPPARRSRLAASA